MNALNTLDQSQKLEIQKVQDFDDRSPKLNSSKENLNLHQTVMKLMKESRIDDLEQILFKVENIETFSELKGINQKINVLKIDESMSLIFPILLKWLEGNKSNYFKKIDQNFFFAI